MAIYRLWDIQCEWNPWLSCGLHFDHTDPALTFHLPGIIICLGHTKQPGYRFSMRRLIGAVGEVTP